MHGPSTSELETASPRLTWSDHNEHGLAAAAEGSWVDALASFGGAADSLATENDVASHEALALVLNNLAHGCFRVGQIDDAIRHAQRACALRVALVGEDAIAVARARADLAVMLSSTGRRDEAMTLITRAIAGIERSAGEEALQLSYVLENAARVAMSAGQPSTAEPYLLRLHALLAVHDLPTDRADALLAGVAQHRAEARVSFGLPVAQLRDEGLPHEHAVLGVEIGEEVRDEPALPQVASGQELRDEPEVPQEARRDERRDEPEALQTSSDEGVGSEAVVEAVDVVEVAEVVSETATPELRADAHVADDLDDLLGDIAFAPAKPSTDVLGLDFELVDFAPAADQSAASSAPPANAAPKVVDVLGFEVRYGTQTDEEASLANTQVRPISTRIPTPPPAPAQNSNKTTEDNTRDRRIRRPNIRWGRASIPRGSMGLAIAGALTIALGASAAWMVLAR